MLSADLTTGLLAYWSLNEVVGPAAVDQAGTPQNGTLTGGPIWSGDGAVHGALGFDGVDDFVSVPAASEFNISTAGFTLSAWVKTTSPNGYVVVRGIPTTDHFTIKVDNGQARFQFDTGGAAVGVTAGPLIADGEWHHVVGVRTGYHSGNLYVDGELAGSFDETHGTISIDTGEALLFGADGQGEYFEGDIDDVKFFRRVLVADEVAELRERSLSPLALPDGYAVVQDTPLSVAVSESVLGNDLSADEVPLVASVAVGPQHGVVDLASDGSFSYTPSPGFSGVDTFSYYVSDGRVAAEPGVVTLYVYGDAQWGMIRTRVIAKAMTTASENEESDVGALLTLIGSDGRFSDLDYFGEVIEARDALVVHLRRLAVFGYYHQTAGSPWHANEDVEAAIEAGWQFVVTSAPSTADAPNWYTQKIFIPNEIWLSLATVSGLLADALKEQALLKYVDSVASWDVGDLSERNGGMNLLYRARVAIGRAVLLDDPTVLPEMIEMVSRDLNGNGVLAAGVRPDFSFHQHNDYRRGNTYQGGVTAGQAVQFYSGTYGVGYAEVLSDVVPWLHATPFAFSDSDEEAVIGFLLEGQQWLFRNDAIEPTSRGRSTALDGTQTGAEDVIVPSSGTALAISQLLSLGIRTEELQSFLERLTTGTTDENALNGNRSFWTSDVMAHQDTDYMAAVRMISQRTLRPETLKRPDRPTAEASQHYFLGDGALTVFQDGNEYGALSKKEIFPVWNWTRVPGTTLEQISVAELQQLSRDTAFVTSAGIGTGRFVGSVSNGQVGLAAMDYGRPLGNVTAKKSWFFFDGAVIALGADIDAPLAANGINTSIAQVLLDGEVAFRTNDDPVQTLTDSNPLVASTLQWVLHDGVGYLPLGGNDPITIQRETRVGDWSDIGFSTGEVTEDVFSMWIDHGQNPVARQYAYAVVPASTQTSLDTFVSESRFTVLENTESLQAVRHVDTATTQIAFYEAGEIEISPGLTIAVDTPSLVVVTENADGSLEVSVSDPAQEATSLELSVSRQLAGTNAVWDEVSDNTICTVTLPDGPRNVDRGRSTQLQLSVADVDSDDQLGEATPLYSAYRFKQVTGRSIIGRDVDMYSFTVLAGQTVAFDVNPYQGQAVDSVIRIFDGSGAEIAFNDNGAAGGETLGVTSYLEHTFAVSGQYFVGVSGAGNVAYDATSGAGDVYGAVGAYNLAILPVDFDDQISEAIPLYAAYKLKQVTGRSVTHRDVDMYSFTVLAGQTVAFDVNPYLGQVVNSVVRIVDGSGAELAFNDNGAAGGETLGAASYVEHTFAVAGQYYVGVSGSGNQAYDALNGSADTEGAIGAYNLAIYPVDFDDQLSEAMSLHAVNKLKQVTGRSITDRDVDMYSFTVLAGQTVAFDVDAFLGQSVDSFIRIFDGFGTEVAFNDNGAAPGETLGLASYLEHTFAVGGQYFIGVSGRGNSTYDPLTGAADLFAATGAYNLIVAPVDT